MSAEIGQIEHCFGFECVGAIADDVVHALPSRADLWPLPFVMVCVWVCAMCGIRKSRRTVPRLPLVTIGPSSAPHPLEIISSTSIGCTCAEKVHQCLWNVRLRSRYAAWHLVCEERELLR